MALAATNYHDVRKFYPPARLVGRPSDPESQQCTDDEPSWIVHIMPFMELENLYDQFSILESVEHDAESRQAMSFVIPTFVCPSRRSVDMAIGVETVFENRAPCG